MIVSFFERVPSSGDAYLLSHIIHDWTEDRCFTILGHCRHTMKPGMLKYGTLLDKAGFRLT
jgi:O-methyltransferase